MSPATARPRVARGRPEPTCFEINDCSTSRIPALSLLRGDRPRDPNSLAARLADQFVTRNRSLFNGIGVEAQPRFDGASVTIELTTSTKIGATPLLSPVTGRPEYGLIVRPRFEWSGIGPMLSDMGWRIVPQPLRVPMLPRSDRKIPPWLLSTIVLARVQAMLAQLTRRFEMVSETRTAPRGSVDWARYATQNVSRARYTDVPCRYPDLRDDRDLRSAIRFTLQKQVQGLESQRSAGAFVLRLIDLCQRLLERVRDVPPRQPAPRELDGWLHGPLRTDAFRDGLQAIEWTVDDRGLAGLSDLQGLPWVMSMEEFFEAWAESVLTIVARRTGGVVRTGRQRQTLTPLTWEPPSRGSQKYLLPDLMLDRGDATIIVDAKYKEHWEEMQQRGWMSLEDELRERHRADLLQVLAYANLATTPRVVVCLVYPCSRATWASLKARGQLVHRASIVAGTREIELLLTAFPMGEPATTVAEEFAKAIA